MLVIAGRIELDAKKREDAVEAARALMEETRREAGCLSYTFSADLTEAGTFYVFEEWESPAALDAHFATAHMARFIASLGALGVKDMKIQRYEVSSVGPVRG